MAIAQSQPKNIEFVAPTETFFYEQVIYKFLQIELENLKL